MNTRISGKTAHEGVIRFHLLKACGVFSSTANEMKGNVKSGTRKLSRLIERIRERIKLIQDEVLIQYSIKDRISQIKCKMTHL